MIVDTCINITWFVAWVVAWIIAWFGVTSFFLLELSRNVTETITPFINMKNDHKYLHLRRPDWLSERL